MPISLDSYDITLDIDSKEHRISGTETIIVLKAESQVRLDAVDIEVTGVSIDGKSAGWRVEGDQVVIDAPTRDTFELTVSFTSRISNGLQGMYVSRTSYGEMFTTQFESTGARHLFPCVDNPACKAQFRLSLIIDSDLEAISNMPVRTVQDLKGKKKVTFDETPRMSTYLLYIGVGKFDSRSVKWKGKDIILAAPKGHLLSTDFPLEVAQKVLEKYEEYFGIEYPLPKMHLIAVPEFAAGAMENWGAITFREVALLVGQSTSTAMRRRVAEVIAHEIAHQWFGNLVTMEWWNDLWLNESFATFMAYKFIDRLFPSWDVWGTFVLSETQQALRGDSLQSSHPIQADVKDPSEIAQIFDEISYGKGASILRMIESFIGEEKFRDGIRNYLKEHMYGNARGSDLWNSLEKASGKPVTRIMEAWIREKGYPIITVEKAGGGYRLRQERFLLSGDHEGTLYPVPLTIARQGGVESILMEAPEIMVGGDGFRHINQGRSGFYRVFYTGDASREVLGRLGSMSNLERLGLINDAFAALLSRRLPVDGYLEVVSSYMNERDFIVVDEISSELLSLTLILPFHQGLRDRAREFMRAQLQRLGEKKEGENENDTVLRSSLQQKLVMVDDDYASSLSELFPRYGDIDPDVRGAVAMAFARSKNSFSPLTLALEQAQSDEDRVNVIRAMGWLQGDELGKFNRLVEEGSVKKQDFYVFYISCSMNPSGRQFSLRNLEFLHSKMVEYFSGTGYEGTVLEAMIPLIGLEDEGETRKKVEAIRGQENSMGISKGLELLAIYSSLRKEVQGG